MFDTIDSPDRLLSSLRPKYLTLSTDLISTLLHFTLNSFTLPNFLLVPNMIASVLPRCKDSLLSVSHLWQDSSYCDKVSAIIFGYSPGTRRAQSSANSNNLHKTLIGISLI